MSQPVQATSLGAPLRAPGPLPVYGRTLLNSTGLLPGGGPLLGGRELLLGSRELLQGCGDPLLSSGDGCLSRRGLLLSRRGPLLGGSGGSQDRRGALLSSSHPVLIATVPPPGGAGLPDRCIGPSAYPTGLPLSRGDRPPRCGSLPTCPSDLPLSGDDLPLSTVNLPLGLLDGTAFRSCADQNRQTSRGGGRDQRRHLAPRGAGLRPYREPRSKERATRQSDVNQPGPGTGPLAAKAGLILRAPVRNGISSELYCW